MSRWLVIVGFAVTADAVQAQDATRSAVTTLDIKACTVLRRGPDGTSWRCPAVLGVPIYAAEGDDRFFFSAGRKPEKRRAGQQTLRAFNTLFSGETSRATVEWRLPEGTRPAQPYAAIVRFYTTSDTAKGEVLIVYRVAGEQSCQVAMVDALANADAISRARHIADTAARSFDCTKSPTVEGLTGKSPM